MTAIKPIKCLFSVNVTLDNTVLPNQGYWTTDTGSVAGEDLFWQGGLSPQPYRWNFTSIINQQQHGSHGTTPMYYYDGNNVEVGDWFVDLQYSKPVKIIQINSKDATTLNCVVEDVERFNTMADPNGVGCVAGDGFIFSLDENGMPNLSNLSLYSGGLSINLGFIEDLMSKFKYRNYIQDYISVYQPSHNLAKGDMIYIDQTGNYIKSINDLNSERTIGQVNSVSVPSNDYFTFRPVGKNISINLSGNPGDIFYLDNSGNYTNIRPTFSAKPVLLKINNNRAIAIDRNLINEKQIISLVPSYNGQTVFLLPSYIMNILKVEVNGQTLDPNHWTYVSNNFTFARNLVGYDLETTDLMQIEYLRV